MASSPTIDAPTAAALRDAIAAAQQGNPDAAVAIATRALGEGASPGPLHAFLGMIEARRGDFGAALPHMAEAHRAMPADLTVAINYIAALIDSGDHQRAFTVATEDLARQDASLRIARYRAFAAQSIEEFAIAAAEYERVIAAQPGDFEALNNLGNARIALDDPVGAVDALESALAIDPAAPPTRMNLAAALRLAGRATQAEQVLRDLARDTPGDARPWHAIYVNAKVDWDNQKAHDALEKALEIDPEDAGLWLMMAVEKGIMQQVPESEAAFARAIALDPTLHDGYVGLAIQYEYSNREHLFPELIAKAETHAIEPGALAFLRALEHRRAGRFAEALEAMDNVSGDIEPQRIAHTRATLLDRLGRSDEAFAAFREAAELHQQSETRPLERAANLREDLERQVELMTPAWFADWSQAEPAKPRPDPAVLLGFPRSGTTLLDTILMGHPDTVVMEEQPPFNLVDKQVGGIAGLAALDSAGLDAARERYFAEVAEVSDWQAGKLLVDKSPLHLHKGLLIHRLFPDAKVILALRHPCDVVLSCYMSNFRLNSSMANFLRLEDAAAFYDLTFRHWEASQALAPLDTITVRYEELVEDVEGVMRPVLDFLSLDWDERALDHQATARSRGLIKTASYSQVTEPIYKRASGRWLRYREQVEPILPVLEPWVEKFGYSL